VSGISSEGYQLSWVRQERIIPENGPQGLAISIGLNKADIPHLKTAQTPSFGPCILHGISGEGKVQIICSSEEFFQDLLVPLNSIHKLKRKGKYDTEIEIGKISVLVTRAFLLVKIKLYLQVCRLNKSISVSKMSCL
jgi:hypothetical protein